MIYYDDITTMNGGEAEPVDAVIGGSPCQGLSVAGMRLGLEDDRSVLFLDQIRVIKEMHSRYGRNKPRYMVWENVPGALSSAGGEDFRRVLEETAKVADETAVIPRPPKGKWTSAGCIMADGWSIAWRILDAQFWGVPQRRRRIALVADFGGRTAPEILFEREGLPGYTAESGEARQETAGSAESGFGTAICIQGNCIDRADTAGCNGRGWRDDDVSYTLNTIDRPAVCIGNGQTDSLRASDKVGALNCMHDQQIVFSVDCRSATERSEINGTLQAKSNGGISLNVNNVIRRGSDVRRLTPLEAERLQGYPDGWTDIGEWTDSKGKKHKTTDSARYKALGNSIALPPWRYVCRKLSAMYDTLPTMGSLFDGIGGFPLIWREINGTDSVPWACEIDEYCKAVTRRRIT